MDRGRTPYVTEKAAGKAGLEPQGCPLGAQVRGLVLELAGVDSVGVLVGAEKHCDNVHVLT